MLQNRRSLAQLGAADELGSHRIDQIGTRCRGKTVGTAGVVAFAAVVQFDPERSPTRDQKLANRPVRLHPLPSPPRGHHRISEIPLMQHRPSPGRTAHQLHGLPPPRQIFPMGRPTLLVVSQGNCGWRPGIKAQRRRMPARSILCQQPPIDRHLHGTGCG